MNKSIIKFVVKENIKLNYNNFLITLRSEIKIEGIIPGQFVNVQIPNSPKTFLRRPFSIFDVDYEDNTISLLIKILGTGSGNLVQIEKGEEVDILFPLGNGFSISESEKKILLVGGGVGIAPLMFLAKELAHDQKVIDILLGARSKEDHILVNEFSNYGKVYLTTDDGSMGEKGFVTNHSIFKSDYQFDKVYCCGPEPMMVSIARLAREREIECEVSLENMMACGFGVCLCCVTPTNQGNKCVCTEGPVFNSKDLQWQI